MALSSLSVVFNANRLRTYKRPMISDSGVYDRELETTVEVREYEPLEEEIMATTVKDVVCGMEIDPESAVAQMEHEGKTYYFCSNACHEKFMAEPEKYSQK